ncbi:MAG: 50S ribosomal protein L6 [Parcubacteria group bacterium]|nr:50S ribosomal protein L6 [Parcubacteria group bacterium]
MSRIGKKEIIIPEKVKVVIEGKKVTISGPLGEVSQTLHPLVSAKKEDAILRVDVENHDDIEQKALWGLFGSLLNNMIVGVTLGFEKKLEINGVGYKAQLSGGKFQLSLGYTHTIEFTLPKGIEGKVEKNLITIRGANKQLVGQVAAEIRALRKPEPYNGKGIKYLDEVIRRKEGKKAKTGE